jgi:tetratricopeptide (TPR) repeat protein
LVSETNEKLNEAISLRKSGEKEASRQLLLEMVSLEPENPEILYQCAWTHDGMGLERDAVQFYERAISSGLAGESLQGAYLGLGSTLRGLGSYARALETLETGCLEFPENKALKVFRAMAHYNCGHSKVSIESLLKLLAETTSDPEIAGFKRAILFYAADLDRVWEK